MIFLFRRRLIKRLDVDLIRKAIIEAEMRTSGEIRVSIAHYFWGRVRPAAERTFRHLRMDRTRLRNGVLFFIVPARRRFVVLGDEGLHARVGQEFWDGLAAVLSSHFRKGEFTDGLVEAVRRAGLKLAAHFPYDPASDANELPDEIDIRKS
ncbi:MAG: TPM domain-containing protein [Candidatus Aminicenantes bacterium]|nr:TPM domain-containing protein [Candidatus Aminicenantes bacterium]